MSLSCLMCQPRTRRDSGDQCEPPYESPSDCRCCLGLDRTWSGGLTPPPYSHLRRAGSMKSAVDAERKGHRKVASTGSPLLSGNAGPGGGTKGEPRLVRSGGMRRDWSFEDLRKRAAAARMR